MRPCYAEDEFGQEGNQMKINVTRDDIRNGKPGKPTACMVALALKRELGISYASVGYREAKILVDARYLKLYFPKSVEKKIRFWDRFHFAFPFSFELIPEGFLTDSAIILQPRELPELLSVPGLCESPQTT
jgi:hypothetical protein